MSKAKLDILNVNNPEFRGRVDAEKYGLIRDVMAEVIPRTEPGMTQNEMSAAVRGTFAVDHPVFPAGDKAGWWMKTVQLDMEARGQMKRLPVKPLRWILV